MAKKKKLTDDKWWEEEFKYRPNGDKNKIIVGNSIRITEPEDEKQTSFKINTTKNFIECVRVMAKRLRRKERTYVVFMNEDQFYLFKGDDDD